ncbi:MAG: family 43 glycosylhydrolase, partial [Saprospiraceae bacterium]|nr:family 43 glycosylhydrolase [Saprospiraceae bacterium]
MTVRSILIGLLVITLMLDTYGQAADALFIRDYIQPVTDENIFSDPEYYNWGSSIVRDDQGMYHLFYARWRRDLHFTGWLTHSEIAHAVSEHPWGPWEYKETVLKGRRGNHWDAITAHNPKIKFFNGKYYLYYISTNAGGKTLTESQLVETAKTGYTHENWKPLREHQRTGVAAANSLDGPWVRPEQPLIEPSGPITTLTVNPAITQGPDGKFYLIVKGDKPNEERFIRNQAIAISDHPDGPFIMQDKPVIDYLDTEDMSLWYDPEYQHYYGVFHAHSFIGMVSSRDGKNWRKATEYVLTQKKILQANGDTLVPERMERPFVFYEDGKPVVLSVAVKKGDDSYCVFLPIIKPDFPVPNKRQLAWQDAELGALISYDLHVFDGEQYNQRENRINPVANYQAFNPKNLDTDQWIKSIKDAGFTFAILTASHETG